MLDQKRGCEHRKGSKGRSMSETLEQQALFQWAAYNETIIPELKLLHAIPNGGKRYKATAVRLKKEGVRSGVPDVFLPVARHDKHGLYVEMKAYRGKAIRQSKEMERSFG